MRRNLSSSNQLQLKIISVGNLHSGGSGKTPLVLELAKYFSSDGVAIVSRGYKSAHSNDNVRVDPSAKNGAIQFGDEPWMMANIAQFPVWIGRERTKSLAKLGKDVKLAILDDGFQHLRVYRDVNLVCINCLRDAWESEESSCLPLGDLREGWEALRHASAIVLIGETASQRWNDFLEDNFPGLPVFFARRIYELPFWRANERVVLSQGERWGAFCGLGNSKAFQSAISRIPQLVFLKAFADHHVYSEADLDWLEKKRQEQNLAGLLTTDKDYFKLVDGFAARHEALASLRIRYELPEQFWYFLKSHLEL